jgi:DNA-binding PadR family transcriptional regulator
MVLLAVLRVGDGAYGVPIARELETQCGHEVALASVYAALLRLEQKGLVTSWLGDATPARGGRAKKYVRVSAAGRREAQATQRILLRLWHGLPAFQQ